MIVGKKIAELTGLDPYAQVCTKHRLRSVDEVISILMKPFKTYRYNKKSKMDEIDRMGISCSRCGYIEWANDKNDSDGDARILIPEENKGKETELTIRGSPTDLTSLQR